MYRYFKTFTENNFTFISLWESKGLSNEKIGSTKTSNYDQFPKIVYDNARTKLRFSGDLLKQNKVTYNHGPIVNIYVVYRLTPRTNNSGVTLENCPFGAVKLTKNDGINKYKYSGYGIGFDLKGSFSHPSGGYGKNVIIFLVLGKDLIQGIDGTTIYPEKKYSANFTVANKNFCLSLPYNGDNSYLSLMAKKLLILKLKTMKLCYIHYV